MTKIIYFLTTFSLKNQMILNLSDTRMDPFLSSARLFDLWFPHEWTEVKVSENSTAYSVQFTLQNILYRENSRVGLGFVNHSLQGC